MITVTQRSKGSSTEKVYVTFDGTPTDSELAKAAGYSSSYFGYHVDRYPDSPDRAVVNLWAS